MRLVALRLASLGATAVMVMGSERSAHATEDPNCPWYEEACDPSMPDGYDVWVECCEDTYDAVDCWMTAGENQCLAGSSIAALMSSHHCFFSNQDVSTEQCQEWQAEVHDHDLQAVSDFSSAAAMQQLAEEGNCGPPQ